MIYDHLSHFKCIKLQPGQVKWCTWLHGGVTSEPECQTPVSSSSFSSGASSEVETTSFGIRQQCVCIPLQPLSSYVTLVICLTLFLLGIKGIIMQALQNCCEDFKQHILSALKKGKRPITNLLSYLAWASYFISIDYSFLIYKWTLMSIVLILWASLKCEMSKLN